MHNHIKHRGSQRDPITKAKTAHEPFGASVCPSLVYRAATGLVIESLASR